MQTKLPVGVEVAGYRIESFVARGGMAEVYRARDLQLNRQVALKLLAPELAENENFRARFLRESRMAASMDHPNIIPIYAAGMADDLLYLAMRYVQGADLKVLLGRQGPLTLDRARLLLSSVGQALDAAHASGLVHRDVKPANVLVGSAAADGREHVYLSDFGLTKRSTSMTGLTAAGFVAGTIDYVAPEQIAAKPVGPEMDMYALGCMLYEVLTGQVPYSRDHDAAVLYAHMFEPPPAVTAIRPDLPARIDDIVATAMAKDPADRYGSCRDLFADLAALDAVVPRARSAEGPVLRGLGHGLPGTPEPSDAKEPRTAAGRGAAARGPSSPVPLTPVWPGTTGGADRSSRPHAVGPAIPAGAAAGAANAGQRFPWRRLLAVALALVLTAGLVIAVDRLVLSEPNPVSIESDSKYGGVQVHRTWRLGGRNGDQLRATIVVPAGHGLPGSRTVERLPLSLFGDAEPQVATGRGLLAISGEASVDLEARLTGGEQTFTYEVKVPTGPLDRQRLQSWLDDQQQLGSVEARRVEEGNRRPS